MNEHYLHLIWKTKRLPFHLLKTIDNKEVKILQIGIYNTASGPDFFNGQIEIDGIRHNGNIEMHIKSSDWNAHGHQHDRAYDNVILHVVYEHDSLIFIEGIPIPTIELKQHIDWEHYEKVLRLTKSKETIACENQLSESPTPIIWNQIELSFLERLNRKTNELVSGFQEEVISPKKLLFHALASAFGMKTNALPFKELAHRIPFERLIKCSAKQTEAVVFGTSGFLSTDVQDGFQKELSNEWNYQKNRLSIHPANRSIWQFKGCRPAGFPSIRLAQFASFIHHMDWSEAFWELPTLQIKQFLMDCLMVEPSDYWRNHYDFGKEKQRLGDSKMSVQVAYVIIINSVAPFLWWLSKFTSNATYREKAVELLESIPAEKNQYIDQWKSRGIVPKNAAESQGLLELLHQRCAKKGCLKCRVGQHLLGQKA